MITSGSWWSFKPDDSEEMRAFFVAFTRAKQRVFFTSCRGRGRRISYIDELVSNAGVAGVAGPRARHLDFTNRIVAALHRLIIT